MRYIAVLAAAILFPVGNPSTVAAQGTVRCYGMPTQIGVVAVREFRDGRGQVEKEIFYRSAAAGLETSCPEEQLRVYETHVYERDALGRSSVERILDAHDQLSRFGRYEYDGAATTPSKQVWFGPQGDRRLEMRWSPATYLYFDEREKVVGVIGVPPQDVEYAIAWGDPVDGWRCGIGLARGTVYMSLQNQSKSKVSALFGDAFEFDLRDPSGRIMPLLPDVAARLAKAPALEGRGIAPGEVGSSGDEFQSRYGRLPPGHYAVVLRHPHPITGVMLVSSQLEVDIR
jgi:hypothetical protein